MNKSVPLIREFDAVIVGSGAVGTLMALLLSKNTNLNIALVDPALKNNNFEKEIDWTSHSRRVSALNYTIFHKLQKELNVDLTDLVEPMKTMEVYTSECGGHFELNAEEYRKEAMAYVADNTQLTAFLRTLLPSNVNCIHDAVDQVSHVKNTYELQCGQTAIKASILIGADGARSTLREKLALKITHVGSPAEALGGQLEVSGAFGADIARQWFLSDGSVLGLLPIKRTKEQKHIMSMVWSQPNMQHLNKSSPDILEQKLNELVSQVSMQSDVKFNFATEPKRWPLRRAKLQTKFLAESFPGLFFIGDAAHTIHPLAGQGMNLGLDDALMLSEKLCEFFELNTVSLKNLSHRYHAQRAFSVNNMMTICESFKSCFEKKSWVFKGVMAFAFKQFDKHTIIKRKIVEMMSY
ncbi:MAG TPA: hypothetical protein DHW71_03995 [Gammaproteobacteria bacterium]|nr:FAD-dependent monooxygenase [Pseudomonadota bacterium]HBF09513.1 hypothetical protein [Gammaproteobacteria bacterium]HCK92122.1 hypothetical protein [Gammaproteobacteria bacterium]